jgi:hypothetical protein
MTNIDRSHELLKETFFVVYHANSHVSAAFIARPIMEHGKLTGWVDQWNRPRLAYADDQIIVLGPHTPGVTADGDVAMFFDAEDLFHV